MAGHFRTTTSRMSPHSTLCGVRGRHSSAAAAAVAATATAAAAAAAHHSCCSSSTSKCCSSCSSNTSKCCSKCGSSSSSVTAAAAAASDLRGQGLRMAATLSVLQHPKDSTHHIAFAPHRVGVGDGWRGASVIISSHHQSCYHKSRSLSQAALLLSYHHDHNCQHHTLTIKSLDTITIVTTHCYHQIVAMLVAILYQAATATAPDHSIRTDLCHVDLCENSHWQDLPLEG